MAMKLYNEENVKNIADVIREKTGARLPSEYQEVEYIESTGTQYIDTGFKPNQNTRFKIKLYANLTNTNYNSPYGENDSNNEFRIGIQSDDVNASWYIRYASQSVVIYAKIDKYEKVINVDHNKNVVDFNGWQYRLTPETSFQSTKNLYLFMANGVSGRNFYGRIYSSSIYDNDVLVRDFIPCFRKSDNVIGMYDLVNNQFYTNQGTGEFIKGNIVTKKFKLSEMSSAIDNFATEIENKLDEILVKEY